MSFAIMDLASLAAGVALVLWATAVRRDMKRGGLLRGAGLMPVGAAQDAG